MEYQKWTRCFFGTDTIYKVKKSSFGTDIAPTYPATNLQKASSIKLTQQKDSISLSQGEHKWPFSLDMGPWILTVTIFIVSFIRLQKQNAVAVHIWLNRNILCAAIPALEQ